MPARMEFISYFMSEKPGREKDLNRLANNFVKETRLAPGEIQIGKIADYEEKEIFRLRLNAESPLYGESAELKAALYKRLLAMGLAAGFLPLDEDGHIIYLLPPYGFEVAFYSPRKGRDNEMFDLVRGVYKEIEGHIVDGQFGQQDAPDGEGEYYIVRLLMQDYLTEPERTRLRLATYFRLLGLARSAGFEVVIQGQA